MTTQTDTAVAVLGEATKPESEPVSGEVVTPLDALVANEKIIEKGLRAYDKQSAAIETTKEEVGAALYDIYTNKQWKARRGKDGKALYKNFGEYLEAKGWSKTASRAYQLMADHRKALTASGETPVAATRGPKPNNPGRSAATFANALISYRSKLAERAEAMTGDSEGERDFVEIAERFAEATAAFVSEFESLSDREKGRAEAEAEAK